MKVHAVVGGSVTACEKFKLGGQPVMGWTDATRRAAGEELVSQIKMIKKAIGSTARTLFHPRELHLHDAKGVRHIRIGTGVQVAAAGAVTAFTGWTLAVTVTVLMGASSLTTKDVEIAKRDRQIAAMQADVAEIQKTADAVADRVEARQKFLAELIVGKANPTQLASLMPDAADGESVDGRYAAALSPLTEVEGRQLAFVDEANTAVEARYRDTQLLLKRLGLSPTRFVRQSRVTAMGGPYEPVGGKDSDPAFQQLFSSWTKVNTLEKGMLSVPALKPVRNYALTSNFGVRSDPFNGGAAMHAGIDMAGPVGEPIYATADGVVTRAGWYGGYGNVIDLGHGRGIETRYGHLSRILVKDGQKVKRGEMIARMGSTGRSTGSHLHYEVRIDGRAVNPVPFLQSAEQLAAVHSRVLDGVGGPELPAAN